MSGGDGQKLYFRLRENGASVFRVADAARTRRLEMDLIAAVNLRKGEVKPHRGAVLSDAEQAEIAEWMALRKDVLAARDFDEICRTVEHLNRAAHWAQSGATDAQLEAICDDLLLAMHDLRAVLVRRQARMLRKRGS